MSKLLQFMNWFIRISKKGIWLIGFIPLLLDYLTTLIPASYLPRPLLNYIEQGGNWNLTLVLVSLGLIISSYLVFLESEQSKEELAERFKKIADSQPKIHVGFMESNGTTTPKIELHLQQIPPKPDFDNIVSEKRSELFARQSRISPSDLPKAMRNFADTMAFAAFSKPNPNYEEEVEQYLLEFREYLNVAFEINLDRAFQIKPIVMNKGSVSASSLSIELEMPQTYERPKGHQEFDRSDVDNELLQFYASEPLEPEPTKSVLDLNVPFPIMSSVANGIAPLYRPSMGPEFEKKDNVWFILYQVDKLVPGKQEYDLDPFWIWAGEIYKPTTWEIGVRLYSEELIKPIDDKVYIEFIID